MSIEFIGKDYKTVGTIGLDGVRVFLSLTRLVQSELGKQIPSGFSPLVSDEILIDEERFIEFVDEFFRQAEHNGKFAYFVRWAEEIEGMYENITGTTPIRKMSGVEYFQPRRYR